MRPDQLKAALDAAFAAHVGKLFEVLCAGIADEASGFHPKPEPDARARFWSGLTIASLAHGEALRKIEEGANA